MYTEHNLNNKRVTHLYKVFMYSSNSSAVFFYESYFINNEFKITVSVNKKSFYRYVCYMILYLGYKLYTKIYNILYYIKWKYIHSYNTVHTYI